MQNYDLTTLRTTPLFVSWHIAICQRQIKTFILGKYFIKIKKNVTEDALQVCWTFKQKLPVLRWFLAWKSGWNPLFLHLVIQSHIGFTFFWKGSSFLTTQEWVISVMQYMDVWCQSSGTLHFVLEREETDPSANHRQNIIQPSSV